MIPLLVGIALFIGVVRFWKWFATSPNADNYTAMGIIIAAILASCALIVMLGMKHSDFYMWMMAAVIAIVAYRRRRHKPVEQSIDDALFNEIIKDLER